MQILDVREVSEWNAGHIPGALHIPGGTLPPRLSDVPDDRPLTVVCGSGYRSTVAASLLLREGRRAVANLIGGMTAYQAAGHRVAAGPISLPDAGGPSVTTSTHYTFGTVVATPLDATRVEVEAALKEQGFGILTEIDVRATMRDKLGIEREPYLILGACNPHLAHRALEADPSVGALLPCNVVLRAEDDRTRVEIMDPTAALAIAGSEGLAEVASEAQHRLRAVVAALEARR